MLGANPSSAGTQSPQPLAPEPGWPHRGSTVPLTPSVCSQLTHWSEDTEMRVGPPWWTAGGSGRSLVAPSCGGSAGGTSWALPAHPWAAPGRPGQWSVLAPGTIPGRPWALGSLCGARELPWVPFLLPTPAFPRACKHCPQRPRVAGSQVDTQGRAGTPRAGGRALTKWKYFSVSKSFTARGKTHTINERGVGGERNRNGDQKMDKETELHGQSETDMWREQGTEREMQSKRAESEIQRHTQRMR